jgi:CheY-like chemotaxis protein
MESAALIPVRVVVVEDNPNDQELLQRQLHKTALGNHVRFFSDPRKALSLLREPGSAPLREGLVAMFLDVNLPYMSGIELLRRVREIEGLTDLPVIVMTTNARPDTLAACKELNVAYVAEKPVTVTQFSKVLADLFYQHQSAAA